MSFPVGTARHFTHLVAMLTILASEQEHCRSSGDIEGENKKREEVAKIAAELYRHYCPKE